MEQHNTRPPTWRACLLRGEAGRAAADKVSAAGGGHQRVCGARDLEPLCAPSPAVRPCRQSPCTPTTCNFAPGCLRVTWCPHALLLRCTSIIQFREVFLTPDYLAIAMEFAPGGDMFQYVKKKKGLQARCRAPPCRSLCCDLCGCLRVRRSRVHPHRGLSCLGALCRSTRRGGFSSS